jgi:hypothetical protein
MSRLSSIVVAGILALGASTAQATGIIAHVGSNNPTDEGWTFNNSGTVVGSVGGGTETTASGSHDYWQIQDLSSSGGRSYTMPLGVADLAGDWRLEASLRVVESPANPGTTIVGGTSIIVADGANYWSFYLSNSEVGPVNDTRTSLVRTWSMDTQSDYHDYVIQFSHNGAGSADDTADFFVDGVLVFDDVGRSGLWNTSSSLVYFGPNSTLGTSDAKFEYVCFNGCSAPPVPAPSSLWLLGSGFLAFRARRGVALSSALTR